MGPQKNAAGVPRDRLDQFERVLHVIEYAGTKDHIELVVAFLQVLQTIAEKEPATRRLQDLLDDEALQKSFRIRLDGENAIGSELGQLIGMRPFKRPEFEDIHALQRTRLEP